MPPAATVDFRAPSKFTFESTNTTANENPSDCCTFNTGVSSSSSSSSIPALNRPPSTPLSRSKPRLFKHRRSSKSSSSTPLHSGINPFRSVDTATCSNVFSQFENVGFVFGVSNSNSNSNIVNGNCHDDNDTSGSAANVGFEPSNLGNNVGVQKEDFNFRVDAATCSNVYGQFENAGFVFGVSNSNSNIVNGNCHNDNDTSASAANVGFEPSKLDNNVSVQKEDFNFRVDNAACSNVYGQFENVGFVFGVSNSNNVNDTSYKDTSAADANVGFEPSKLGNTGVGFRDSGTTDSRNNVSVQKEELNFRVAEGAPFSVGDQIGNQNIKSGEVGSETELSNELKKLNIENREKGNTPVEDGVTNNTDVMKDGNQFFVFKSGEKMSDLSTGSSSTLEDELNAGNSDITGKRVSAEKTDGFGSQSIGENVFVSGSSETSASPGVSSSQSSALPPEISGLRQKKDVFSSTFSSSSLGAEVESGEPEAEFASPVNSEGLGASSTEFKLPMFDGPLFFSANLCNELGRKPESGVRTRVLRDKHLRRTKGKSKQSKPAKQEPIHEPLPAESVTQNQEASECYSPMDFSPYEETVSNNDIPPSGPHATDQSNVENGNSSGLYTESQPNPVFTSNGLSVNSAHFTGISSNMSAHDGEGGESEEKFTFNSNSGHNSVSSVKRQQRRRYKMKTASVSGTTSTIRDSSLGTTPHLSRLQGQGGNFSASETRAKLKSEADEVRGCDSALSAAEKACDKWRRRGNEAYEKGELSKAEDFYTWGVNCIPPGDASAVAFRPLVRCYSNRAATRMALGRVRESIQDCLMALKLDPTFLRAQIRAANCHLLLGELEDAIQGYSKVMESTNIVCLDRQIVISASDGIQKSQKVIECINRSAELLKLKTSEAAASALESIAEAMSISLYSEKLLEMKAEALCMLRKHEEALALCQQTLDFAEKNFTATLANHDVGGSCLNVKQWRHHISSRCHFHLGRLEAALDLLEKQELGEKPKESLDPLAVTIRELLKQKRAGNAAFQSGKHAEAIEHYTSAISSSMESRPFAAVCFCNRAAAYQALGQIADAIADCSLAIALDENYAKAVSRRATLHELIRDYKQAAVDLQRLLSLLEKQSHEKSKQSGSGNGKELRQVQHRLSTMEDEAKGEVPLNLYLILGTKRSDSASEIKKAYRKAALKHHPDKAGQSLVRSDVGDEGRVWKDIAELVHKDADRLFKMIGEAYAVLSDPTKREEYDHEENMRKVLKESNNIRSFSRRHSEYYYSQGFPFERSSNRRNWQDSYRTNTNSYSHRRW